MAELTQSVVEQYIALCHGRIMARDIWAELDIGPGRGRTHLRVILDRCVDKGLVRRVQDGNYQRVDGECNVIDWLAADLTNTVNLVFPFSLEQYAIIYPKSIIVVAGTKNAGKTAFLYNFIVDNMGEHKINLFNSETGQEQMKRRFSAFPVFDGMEIPPFDTFERYDNFSEVIKPDEINVIDYLDSNSEVYMVGAEINAIFRKLTTGVAVIAMQKPPASFTIVRGVKKMIERDLAYGGAFSAKHSVLYLSLSEHHAKLVYVKTPRNPKVNPTNMQWSFHIGHDGVSFEDVKPYTEPTEQPPWYNQ